MDFILIIFSLGLSYWLYSRLPLKTWGFSSTTNIGIAILLGCFGVVYGASLLIVPSLEQEKALSTCGSLTKEGQCYRLPALVCQSLWSKYQDECTWEIKKNLGDRVTALIGPAVKKCTRIKFDKAVYFARKSSTETDCGEYFNYLIKDRPPG